MMSIQTQLVGSNKAKHILPHVYHHCVPAQVEEAPSNEQGEPTSKVDEPVDEPLRYRFINRLRLRNNQLKFETSEKLPNIVEEFREYTSN